ncbi:MAG TPA: MFS transporter [Candidatus Dormibacteraeota bacterium]|nr:MFS transporter [Candidatus Dormibacteraeota bacterium]
MLGGSRLWRQADFLKLWAGQTISVVGSQVTVLALPTIAILLLHATAGQVGLLAALERLAFPILALLAGVWIDRVRRRPLMIAADGLRAAALLSVPLVAAVGTLTLLQLYAVAAILGVGTVIFDIAYLAYIPTLAGRADLLEANTKLEVSHSGSYLIGPALAGGLIQLVGAAQAMLADAFSFLVSVATIAWIRQPEPSPRVEGHPRVSVLADVRNGVRLVFGNPILRSMAVMLTVGAVGFHLAEPAFYLFAYRNLRITPAALGLVFAAGGVGAVIGALLVGTVVRRLGLGTTLTVTIIGVGIGFILWPLALVATPLAVLMGAEFLVGVCDSIYNVSQVSLRQSVTPDQLQGRMTATLRTMFWGAWPLANLAGGILAGAVGAPLTIVIGGLIGMASALIVVVGPLGRLREQPVVAG